MFTLESTTLKLLKLARTERQDFRTLIVVICNSNFQI
jgi:hypothetical protein